MHTWFAAAKIVLQTSQISGPSNVAEVAAATVRHFINLDLFNPHTHSDGVVSYTSELLTLGRIWHGFHDATKEGDGDRIIKILETAVNFVQGCTQKKLQFGSIVPYPTM